MSVHNLWEKDEKNAKVKSSVSSSSNSGTPSSPTPNRGGDAVFDNYMDLIDSRSNVAVKDTDPAEKPFDFHDDEEFTFGVSLMNNHIACVGDNFSKLFHTAQEPWPDNVKLFQPYEVEQILLPDNASCLAVQAFLKMCNLPFEVEMRWNAEFMSPSGRVPFIKCGAFVVSELEPIVQFVANKGVSLCSRLSAEEKAEMRAYMSLITNVLLNAELYISWIDNDTFNTVTKVRNASVYPWPLGWIQTRSKRNAVAKRLKALHWLDKTLDQVLADVEQCCNSLSQRLGDQDFFFGSGATPLDALVYGHVRALLSASGPRAGLLIQPVTSALLRLVGRITRITGLKLTSQEDYLLTQACHLSYRRRSAPDSQSDRSTRSYRSKPANKGRDNVNSDAIGYKPFASNLIKILTNKDGKLTCQVEGRKSNAQGDQPDLFISDLIEDLIDQVDETIIYNFSRKVVVDFEVISYPNDKDTESVSKNDSTIDTKYNGLDTIEENEMSDICSSIDDGIEDVIQVHPYAFNDTDAEFVSKCGSVIEKDNGLDTIEENDISDISISLEDGIEDIIQIINEVTSESDSVVEDMDDNLSKAKYDALGMESSLLSKTLTDVDDESPTELDALVFGHVFTIITTRLPSRRLADTVRKHATLVAHAKRIDEKYFKRP